MRTAGELVRTFGKSLRNFTILGLLAGAIAGSVAGAFGSYFLYSYSDILGAEVDVGFGMMVLDVIQKDKLDLALSFVETNLDTDTTRLVYSEDHDLNPLRNIKWRSLVAIARYRAEYPIIEKETDPDATKEVHQKIKQVLAYVLAEEQKRQPLVDRPGGPDR